MLAFLTEMKQTSSANIVAIKPSMEYAKQCMSMRLSNARYSATCAVDPGRRWAVWRHGSARSFDLLGIHHDLKHQAAHRGRGGRSAWHHYPVEPGAWLLWHSRSLPLRLPSEGPATQRQAPDQSGCRDLNPGPPAPKAGALTKLRHIPLIAP
jgi:hypothetical protein